jgi:hypothetical protein
MEGKLDHGMLNVPLAKRGNIDAQIDAYKATEAAKAKADRKSAAAARAVLKTQAKAALADLVAAEGLLASKAAKLNITRAALLEKLTDWSKWEPAKLIKLHADWVKA